MFTLLRNFRTMFMLTVSNNMAGEVLPITIDADGDGKLEWADIRRFDENTQAAIRRVLGDTPIDQLKANRRAYIEIQALIENGFVVDRQNTQQESTQARDTHRADVGEPLAGTEFLADASNGTVDIFSGGLIKPGESGARVTALQEALDPFFTDEHLSVTGTYDSKTASAVKGMQKYYNDNSGQAAIDEDGVFGNQGRTALRWMQENVGANATTTNSTEQRRITRDPYTRQPLNNNTERASNSGDRLTNGERRRAIRAINDMSNAEQVSLAQSLGLTGTVQIGDIVDAIAQLQAQNNVAIDGKLDASTLSSLNESSFTFTRTLRRGMRGEDVRALQRILTAKGYNTNGVDGVFGGGTDRALRNYQRQELGQGGDGIMSLNGATMRSFANAGLNSNVPTNTSELGREIIGDLSSIEQYLEAYNRIHGDKERLLSSTRGVLGIINQMVGSNSDALARELGVTPAHVREITGDNGNNQEAVTRFVGIAVLSALLTGGSSLAVELFGINVGTNYKPGLEVTRILTLMGQNGNLDARMRNLLLSSETTSGDLEGIFDVQNNESMIPANLRRHVRGVFGNDIGAFFNGVLADKNKVEGLIDDFENAQTIAQGEAILREIYDNSLDRVRRAEGNSPNALQKIRRLESSLAGIGANMSHVINLDAKNNLIRGINEGPEIDARAAEVDQEIGARELGVVLKAHLDSPEAYGFSLPNPPTIAELTEQFNRLKGSKVEGDTHSMLAYLIGGVETHFGMGVTADEFKKSFLEMKKLDSADINDLQERVLSNTGRRLSQSFQGEVESGNITVMTLRGTTIYFRGECTNILVLPNSMETTITGRNSIPIAVGVNIGGSSAGEGVAGSTPGVDNPVDIADVPTLTF